MHASSARESARVVFPSRFCSFPSPTDSPLERKETRGRENRDKILTSSTIKRHSAQTVSSADGLEPLPRCRTDLQKNPMKLYLVSYLPCSQIRSLGASWSQFRDPRIKLDRSCEAAGTAPRGNISSIHINSCPTSVPRGILVQLTARRGDGSQSKADSHRRRLRDRSLLVCYTSRENPSGSSRSRTLTRRPIVRFT